MYNGIDGPDGHGVRVPGLRIVVNVEVGGKGIEDLAGICEVCFEGIDRGVGEGRQVEIEDFMAAGEEIGDHMAAGLA